MFLFSTCRSALHTWRQMRHGWLNGPVYSDSQPHSFFHSHCLFRTYGQSSHHTCTSTCFHRPRCLELGTPANLSSKKLAIDVFAFNTLNLMGEISKVCVCPQISVSKCCSQPGFAFLLLDHLQLVDMRYPGKQVWLQRGPHPLTFLSIFSSLWKLRVHVLEA